VLHSTTAVSAAVWIAIFGWLRGRFPSVRLRLSLPPRDPNTLIRNRTCAEESVLYFSDAALLDFPPRTQALQVWWVGLFETERFANQIAG
jgi:hypothetical protein